MLILITGASKGIGFEMVNLLSKDPTNLIIAVSRNTDSLNKLVRTQNTHSILPIKADITKAAQQKKIFQTIKSLNIGLDVLVNNAGQIVNKPFEKITEKELHAVYATNVFAPFTLIQTLLPLMSKKTRGHIVNIGSMGGFQGSSKFPGLSAYSSSKTALSGLTEVLAEELKPKNIAVNCLALGSVQTEMLAKAFPGYKAPLKAVQMAEFICHFATTGQNYFNGKIIPVSSTTP
ncbi:short-chain dehydrogenase [Sphingobacteriaceae bacterium]|nr:short-chain dehydrogenase [Sphingobacteriaceae bacterium]